MSPAAYARQAPTSGRLVRGTVRLGAFVTGWWLALGLVARVGGA